MARIKYYYDTETCKYERVKTSIWDVLLNFLGLFIITLLIAAGLVFLYIKVFPNKKVAQMQTENEYLASHRDTLQSKIKETKYYISYLQEKDKKLYVAITGAELREETGPVSDHKKYLNELKKGYGESKMIEEKIEEIKGIRQVSKDKIALYNKIVKKHIGQPDQLRSIPAIQPIRNPELKKLASGFGYRTHPLYKVRVKHEGIDFSAPEGTPIYATGDGVISVSKTNYKEAGNYLEIDHKNGFKSAYSHLQKFIVQEGQRVKRGDIIGYVGSTGKALSAHLGYEIIYTNKKNVTKKVNPIHYFFMDTNGHNWHLLFELSQIDSQTLS